MKKLFTRIHGFLLHPAGAGIKSDQDEVDFNIHDVLTVHPTELNIPFELNKKEKSSYRIQLTNKTDMLVAYYFSCSWWSLRSVSPNADTYVGTILPRSTYNATLKLRVPPPAYKNWLQIWAHVAKDGVKAEDISRENLLMKSSRIRDYLKMPVNSCSAVPGKKKNRSLLDDNNNNNNEDDNNLLHQPINDEVYVMASKGKGSNSRVRSRSSNEMLSIILFSDDEIKDATNGLSDSSKIGHGGYGTVYKGNLHGSEVAIKILDSNSQQGMAEFLQEMEVLGRMKHQNLVKLIGACVKLRALVYEFLLHGSVEDYLKKDPGLLTWQIRTRIVYEICSALTFLHSRQPQPVVHGDLKPANILLDIKFISKLADFGLCRFLPGGTATVALLETQNIQGTPWYIDPDFLETGKLTVGCDVYSFGITMLRILTGAPAARVYRKVVRAIREKSLMAMVDSSAGKWPENVAEYLARMGLECCEPERKSSKLMKDISTGLQDILTKIDT